ncbi:fad-dependent urate hydroxylase [Fagus crenata]
MTHAIHIMKVIGGYIIPLTFSMKGSIYSHHVLIMIFHKKIIFPKIKIIRHFIGDHEVCRVRRNMLLEALAKELPSATIRYSSKVVSIEESSFYKLVHLVDGTTYKTKILRTIIGLSPSPCSSLEMVFDLVLFLVMITLFIGFSLRLYPTKVGCGVVLIVVFWEVGRGYGGVTAKNGQKRDGMEGDPLSLLLGPARPWQSGKGERS